MRMNPRTSGRRPRGTAAISTSYGSRPKVNARQARPSRARVELLWDHIATAWWSTRLGVRQDAGVGPSRTWLAAGVAGLAPGFIELEATAYLGEGGRSALRVSADYDLLITQRLVLQPELEFNLLRRR